MSHLPTLLAAALAAGTLAGLWFPSYGPVAVVAGLAAAGAAGAAWAGRCAAAVVLAAAVAAAAALSMARGAAAFDAAAAPSLVGALDAAGLLDDDAPRPRPAVTLTGRLTQDAAIAGPTVQLRLDVHRAAFGPCSCPLPVRGDVLIGVAGGFAGGQAHRWRAGRAVSITATVRRPIAVRNLGAPDATLELVRRRLALTGSVKSALLVDEVAAGRWFEEAAAALRARARQAIATAAGDDRQAAAIGIAVLVGDRAGLDGELTARLQRAGTFHVIAISGGNIALLCLLALGVFGWIFGAGRVALALTAVFLVAYAFVVGGGASVLRATGMAVVGLAARTIDQKGLALNVLAVTGGLLVVADPLVAGDTGFWLTTAATAGLLVGLGESGAIRSWRRLVRSLVLTSIWAELALLPIVASAFQQVTVAGVLLSAVAIPGMALAQLASMAAVAADTVAPWGLVPSGVALRLGAALVTESARVTDALPFLSWRVPAPHPAAVATYYLALAAWLWTRVPGAGHGRARLRPVSAVALVVAAGWIAVAPLSLIRWRGTELEVAVLDVGQGDAIALRFPNGTTMLVDAGGRGAGSRFDVGARVVGPTLRARGIRRLDYLVVTHADADHIGGAASLVDEFQPAEVWTGVPVAADPATAVLRDAALAAGAAWRTVQRGDRVGIGAAEIAVLHPPPPEWERQRVRNDDSVVLAVALGGVRVLLTGDISGAVEAAVAAEASRAAAAWAAPPGVTVLKVAHHGSAGSTSLPFLEAMRPAAAIVSAGADDPFGHPARPALDRLAAARIAVWRTDRDGEVALRTDGRRLELSAFSGRTRRWGPSPLEP